MVFFVLGPTIKAKTNIPRLRRFVAAAILVLITSLVLSGKDKPQVFEVAEQISGQAWLQMEGEIDHAMTADFAAPAQGTLRSINITDGAFVKKGALLYSLSSPDLSLKRTTTLNRIADLELSLSKHGGSESLTYAKKLLDANNADAALQLASIEHNALREMELIGLASQRELLEARRREELARGQQKISQQERAFATATYENTLRNQRRELDTLKQTLEEIERQVAQLEPTAPFDGYGRIGRTSKDCTGCLLMIGSTPAAGQILVKVYSEKRIVRIPKGVDDDRIQEGASVKIEFHTSTLESILSVISVALPNSVAEKSSNSQARSLYATIPDNGGKGLPNGVKKHAQLSIQVHATGFRIPTEYVAHTPDGMFVNLLKDGLIVRRKIVAYMMDDGTIIAEQGVALNDTLVAQ